MFQSKHKGESLIETVISILIIAVIISSILVITNYIHTSRARWNTYNELQTESVTLIDQISADISNGVDVMNKEYGGSTTKTITGKSGKEYNVASNKVDVKITQDSMYGHDVYLVEITARTGGDTRVITKTILTAPAG